MSLWHHNPRTVRSVAPGRHVGAPFQYGSNLPLTAWSIEGWCTEERCWSRAALEGYRPQFIEVLRQHVPVRRKAIANATGIEEISCSPVLSLMQRTGSLDGGKESR
jgi:hypothetical protein